METRHDALNFTYLVVLNQLIVSAPLKSRPYGAIQVRLLLLYYYYYYYYNVTSNVMKVCFSLNDAC